MSETDSETNYYIGACIHNAVSNMRQMRGCWRLDVDPNLSGKSWEHIQAIRRDHPLHTEDGILRVDRTVECVGWDMVDPWHPEEIVRKVYGADFGTGLLLHSTIFVRKEWQSIRQSREKGSICSSFGKGGASE